MSTAIFSSSSSFVVVVAVVGDSDKLTECDVCADTAGAGAGSSGWMSLRGEGSASGSMGTVPSVGAESAIRSGIIDEVRNADGVLAPRWEDDVLPPRRDEVMGVIGDVGSADSLYTPGSVCLRVFDDFRTTLDELSPTELEPETRLASSTSLCPPDSISSEKDECVDSGGEGREPMSCAVGRATGRGAGALLMDMVGRWS